MNVDFIIKYKWWIVGGLLGLVGSRLLSSSGNTQATSSYGGIPYDPALVQAGIAAGLETDRINAEKAIASDSNATALKILELESTNQQALAQLDSQTAIQLADRQIVAASNEYGYDLQVKAMENDTIRQGQSIQERMFGAQLAADNANAANAFALAERQSIRDHDIQSYQTMVVHDSAKKGVAVNFGTGSSAGGMGSKDSIIQGTLGKAVDMVGKFFGVG